MEGASRLVLLSELDPVFFAWTSFWHARISRWTGCLCSNYNSRTRRLLSASRDLPLLLARRAQGDHFYSVHACLWGCRESDLRQRGLQNRSEMRHAAVTGHRPLLACMLLASIATVAARQQAANQLAEVKRSTGPLAHLPARLPAAARHQPLLTHPSPLPQWEGWSCDDVTRLPAEADACAFVRAKCVSGSLVDYLQLYYCHVRPRGPVLGWLMLVRPAAAAGAQLGAGPSCGGWTPASAAPLQRAGGPGGPTA